MFHLIKNNTWKIKAVTIATLIEEIIRQRNSPYVSCQETNYSKFKSKALLFGNIWCFARFPFSASRLLFPWSAGEACHRRAYCLSVSSHLPWLDVSLSILKHSFSSGSGHYTLICDAGVTRPPSSCCPVTNNSLTCNIVIVFVCYKKERLTWHRTNLNELFKMCECTMNRNEDGYMSQGILVA